MEITTSPPSQAEIDLVKARFQSLRNGEVMGTAAQLLMRRRRRGGAGRGLLGAGQEIGAPDPAEPPPVDLFANRTILQKQREFLPAPIDKIRLADVQNEKELKPADRSAWFTYRGMSQTFTQDVTFTLRGPLGFGGQGLVVRYDQLDEENKVIRSIAVKRSLTANAKATLIAEKMYMKDLWGADHIVQLLIPPRSEAQTENEDAQNLTDDNGEQDDQGEISLIELSLTDLEASPKKAEAEGEDEETDMIIMECLDNGTVATIIHKVCERRLTVPNKILWRFMRCLVRGCIEMSNPPDDMEAADGLQKRQMIHLDLDPRNTFVDKFEPEAGEHDITPRLKIGDFGCAQYLMTNARNDYRYHHELRCRGKIAFSAPEQFSAEWDILDRDVDDFPHKVAGNYGAHTNIWGIALIMVSLITKCYPGSPPQAVTVKEQSFEYITYGNYLMDAAYDDTDHTLRRLVMLCMAHDPARRPSLDDLIVEIEANCNKNSDNLDDDALRNWINEILWETSPKEAVKESSAVNAN